MKLEDVAHLVSFRQLTDAVTCLEVLSLSVRLSRIKQRSSDAEKTVLSQEEASVTV